MCVPPSIGTFARDHLEPISIWDAANCTIEIRGRLQESKSTRNCQGHLQTFILNRAKQALMTTSQV